MTKHMWSSGWDPGIEKGYYLKTKEIGIKCRFYLMGKK